MEGQAINMTEPIVPHENDILMGRGGKNNQHVGNEKLRSMARMQSENYRKSSKKGKSYISRELVKSVRQLSPPGRFLKKNNISGEWEDVGDEVAREKASQVLRDAVSVSIASPSDASEKELDMDMQATSNEHRRSSSAPPIMAKSSSGRRRDWEETTSRPIPVPTHYDRTPPPHHHHAHHPGSVYYPPVTPGSMSPPVAPGSISPSTPKRRRYYHTHQSWDERLVARRTTTPPAFQPTRSSSYSGGERFAPRSHVRDFEPPAAGLMGDLQSGEDDFDLFDGELLRDPHTREEHNQDDLSPHDLHSDTF
mmetsp:Transcript_22673/g.52359  ORF Transcript_22673/g.52359 Transcript_22673/m.52359 type:complete len:308 (-) Transcript_22673:193-1116(-)